jgi:hypothetical protein
MVSFKIMRQPHYRITFAKTTDQKFAPFMSEVSCEANKFRETLQNFENTFLSGFRCTERTSIGTPDNECERYIYEARLNPDDRIFLYIYPPR